MRIFISYRTTEAIFITQDIENALNDKFGSGTVFKDVREIPLGADYRSAVSREVAHADVMVVVIDPNWLVDSEGNKRFEDPNDMVRAEVEFGLARSFELQMILVLVNGAKMPVAEEILPTMKRLLYLPTFEILEGEDFDTQIQKIVRNIEERIEDEKHSTLTMSKVVPDQPVSPYLKWIFLAMGVLIVVAVILFIASNGIS